MAIDQYGQIIRRTPRPIPIRTNPYVGANNTNTHSPSSFSSYNPSLWDRFDDFIGSIGNWFADYSENITSVLAVILFACGAIPFIIWLFSLGLFWGIIAGIFLGGIAYYALMIIVGIFIWIANIVLGVVRYIFYSGITFLLALAVVGLVIGVNHYSSSQPSDSGNTESVTLVTTNYCCTASVLNVRSGPSQSYSVLGVIRYNDVVEVYEITNGFAKIKFNGGYGYASIQYLKKQDE